MRSAPGVCLGARRRVRACGLGADARARSSRRHRARRARRAADAAAWCSPFFSQLNGGARAAVGDGGSDDVLRERRAGHHGRRAARRPLPEPFATSSCARAPWHSLFSLSLPLSLHFSRRARSPQSLRTAAGTAWAATTTSAVYPHARINDVPSHAGGLRLRRGRAHVWPVGRLPRLARCLTAVLPLLRSRPRPGFREANSLHLLGLRSTPSSRSTARAREVRLGRGRLAHWANSYDPPLRGMPSCTHGSALASVIGPHSL